MSAEKYPMNPKNQIELVDTWHFHRIESIEAPGADAIYKRSIDQNMSAVIRGFEESDRVDYLIGVRPYHGVRLTFHALSKKPHDISIMFSWLWEDGLRDTHAVIKNDVGPGVVHVDVFREKPSRNMFAMVGVVALCVIKVGEEQ